MIDSAEDSNCSVYPVAIKFKGHEDGREYYGDDGNYRVSWNNLLDIIRIEPATFDWNDVRQGMAFEYTKDGDIVFFVANNFARKYDVVVSRYERCTGLFSAKKSDLTRAPEHDLDLEEG